MQFSIVDKIIRRIKGYAKPLLGSIRKQKLNNTDFTIISNNCWGGVVYEHFNLQKRTPTVGCYIFSDDYLKLIRNLRYYVSLELKMISFNESKYKQILMDRKQEDVPIGLLDDIEIIFLHYSDPIVAKDKWERRKKRINWNNIIFKFSYMNLCNEKYIEEFENIPRIKKVLFISNQVKNSKNGIVVPSEINGQVGNDTFFYDKYINLYELINSPITSLD